MSRLIQDCWQGPMQYNSNDPTYTATNIIFSTLRNKSTKKGNKMAYKVVIKDGGTDWKFNAKKGTSEYVTIDDVLMFDSLADAMVEFLTIVSDDYNESKVTLSFTPKKGKGKK